MPVNIIDTLKPKNNGSFPVVEAADVAVSEELRLPEALAAKADASDLASTDALVATKANASDVAAATAELQGEIDQIVISASAESVVAPEVAAARVGADGTTYQTLKARLDAADTKVSAIDKARKVLEINDKYESVVTGNLIDENALISGYYLLETGEIAPSATGYYVTDFIPLFGNDIIAQTGGSQSLVGACIYDADFNFVKYYKGKNVTHEYTTGDAYIRIMVREEGLGSDRAFYGTVLRDYTPFASDVQKDAKDIYALDGRLTTAETKVEANELAIAAATSKLATVDATSKTTYLNQKYEAIINGNLIDKTTLISGYYLSDAGELLPTSQSGYYVTDFIPLFGKNISALTGGSNALIGACVYDADFDFVSSHYGRTISYQCESGAAYIRLMLRDEVLSEARAFYGDVLKPYVAFLSDVQKNASDIADLDARETETANTLESITDQMVPADFLVFKAFDTPTTPLGSVNFNGFATPYEINGTITAVKVNGSYFMSGITSATYKLQILASNFSTVIAEVSKEVTKHNGLERFELSEPVELSGVYYICVTTDDEGANFSIQNETTERSMRSMTTPNKYRTIDGTWSNNISGYDLDVYMYTQGYVFPDMRLKNTIYVGDTDDCQFADVQSAINSISDDAADNPYIIYVKPGTYEPFSMVYTNAERTSRLGRVRYISVIGLGCRNDVVFFDNKGNYKFSPCEIFTNGLISNITFIDKTDAEHHTQETGRTFAYAVHSDFGTCKTRFENCYMYSNAGPAIGIGTWQDELLEFENCRFESDCDGTFGDTGHGAFFCHTATDGTNRTNQQLRVHDCIAIATAQTNGSRLAVIAGYEGGTYSYELQNFGSFGQNGPAVSLQAPDDDLLSPYCFNNVPSSLNKA